MINRFIFILVIYIKFCIGKNMVMPDEEIDNNIDDLNNLTPEELALLTRRFDLIFPGTKWCGPGDKADNKDDLGKSKEADACCRDHDHCDSIPAGATKLNLTNTGSFTRLSCDCDETFRKCLHDAHTKTASTVGFTYFNIIGTQCYKNEYPIIGCNKKGGLIGTKCVEYSLNTNAEKLYQWFDVPSF